ncbi:hypothetical protein D3C71_1122850 [compost metagenome]
MLGDVAALFIHQQMLQHDALRRVLDHNHHFIAAAAHGSRALIAGLEQDGFVEGEIHGVFALHGQDGIVVTDDAGGCCAGGTAGGGEQQQAGVMELH